MRKNFEKLNQRKDRFSLSQMFDLSLRLPGFNRRKAWEAGIRAYSFKRRFGCISDNWRTSSTWSWRKVQSIYPKFWFIILNYFGRLTPGGPGASRPAGRGAPVPGAVGAPVGLGGPVHGIGGPAPGLMQPPSQGIGLLLFPLSIMHWFLHSCCSNGTTNRPKTTIATSWSPGYVGISLSKRFSPYLHHILNLLSVYNIKTVH